MMETMIQIGALMYDDEGMEGDIIMSQTYRELSPIERADIASDWLDKVTEIYNQAVSDLYKQLCGERA